MAIARFRKVCVDAIEPQRLGRFWSGVLDREWRAYDNGEGGLFGPTRGHTVWFNKAAEPRTVKHRVHLDIYARTLADLEKLGARVLEPQVEGRHWTVMADPEDGEFCAFLRDEVPVERNHGLVVDSADPAAQAVWWSHVYGGDVEHNDKGWSTVEHVPGMPILTMDFNPVPEPKTVKNRIHWDVDVPDLQALLDAGATLLRPRGGDIDWHVLADPEGNEFCAFVED